MSERAESPESAAPADPAESATPPQSAEEIATEGVFIAAATTRLTIKNRILVDTLAGDIEFSVDRYVDFARETLRELARESEAEAWRIEEMMRQARRRRSRPLGMHDYQKADLGNLKHRRDQADFVARRLRERAADEEGVKALIRLAHEAAWSEISRNIQFNLDSEFATIGSLTPKEELDRRRRMREVMRIDLPMLERDLRVVRKRQTAAARPAGKAAPTSEAAAAPPSLFARLWRRIRAPFSRARNSP